MQKLMFIFLRIGFVALTGCSTTGGIANHAGLLSQLDEAMDQASCKLGGGVTSLLTQRAKDTLGSEQESACRSAYGDNREMRLLRAHLVATVLVRYGAARIEDYSSEKEMDANRLMTAIKRTVKKLDEAVKVPNEGIQATSYPVLKADLYITFVDLATAALRPTAKEVGNLVLASPTDRLRGGKDLILRAIEDALYKDAYAAWMKNLRAEVLQANTVSTESYKQAWSLINEHLVAECTRLEKLAGMDEKNVCAIKLPQD